MPYPRNRSWQSIAQDIPEDYQPTVDFSERQAKCDLLRQRQLEYRAWTKRYEPFDDEDMICLDYYFVLCDELQHERELLANHRVFEYEVTTKDHLERRIK